MFIKIEGDAHFFDNEDEVSDVVITTKIIQLETIEIIEPVFPENFLKTREMKADPNLEDEEWTVLHMVSGSQILCTQSFEFFEQFLTQTDEKFRQLKTLNQEGASDD